jgi:hypothetical protein
MFIKEVVKMVAKQRVEMKGLEVWVEPISLSRKFLEEIHFPFPYFHFMKPKWKLHVKKLPEHDQTNKLCWWLLFSDNRTAGDELDVPYLNPNEERIFEIGEKLISPIGNTALCVAPIESMPWNQGKRVINYNIPHQTLCEFRSTAEEELFVGVLAGIIVGVFLFLLG